MSEIHQITPMLHVPDLKMALDFFTQVLRFDLVNQEPHYAYLQKGPAGLRVLEAPECSRIPLAEARLTVYLDVSDVDQIYDEILPQLILLPEGDVRSPTDQTWQQREVWIRMPDGNFLAFGQPVSSQ